MVMANELIELRSKKDLIRGILPFLVIWFLLGVLRE